MLTALPRPGIDGEQLVLDGHRATGVVPWRYACHRGRDEQSSADHTPGVTTRVPTAIASAASANATEIFGLRTTYIKVFVVYG